MKVQQTTFHKSAHTYNILDDSGKLITRVADERLARQFAASDRMLEVCRLLTDLDKFSDSGGGSFVRLLSDARKMARKVIEELE